MSLDYDMMHRADVPLKLAPGAVDGDSDSFAMSDQREYTAWERRMEWNRVGTVEFIVESSWITPTRFLLFKLCVWLWSLAIWTLTLSKNEPVLKFFVFLTNWNQTSLCIYLTCSLWICWQHKRGRHSSVEEGTRAGASSYQPAQWFVRFTYFMTEHAFVWTLLVVLLYWTTEFPHWLTENNRSTYELFANISVHGITMIIIGSDVWLGRVEFVFQHVHYILAVSVLYTACNGIYCAIAGGYLYQILQWNSFVTALAIIGALCLVILAYPFGRFVTLQRNKRSGNLAPPLPGPSWCVCSR
jgi:hypothetical protein